MYVLRCPECGSRLDAAGFCARDGAVAPRCVELATVASPPGIPGFRLDSQIAIGGQGTVWLGHRVADGVRACIKLSRRVEARAWRREVDLLRRAGDELAPGWLADGTLRDGTCWLAMRYLAEDTLAARMRGSPGPRTCGEVAELLAPLAETLARLHELGIVHCDVKPENVVLDARGAKLLDFGSARTIDEQPPDLPPGTAEYMAPERCTTPGSCGIVADVYALAATTYELLAGAPPFWGAEELVLDAHRCRRVPSVRLLGLPPELDLVLRRALAKDPRARTADARTFAAELLPVLRRHAARAGFVRGPDRTIDAGRRRVATVLVWLHSDAPAAAMHQQVAALGGVLAHSDRSATVIAFPPRGGDVLQAAITAAQTLHEEAWCRRALVDEDTVSCSDEVPWHVMSPAFGDAARYPDARDPYGVLLTRAALERGAQLQTAALPHRSDRVELLGRRRDPADVLARPPSLCGRDDELTRTRELVELGMRGVGALLTVRGDPGSGRTRLAEEIARSIVEQHPDALVLRSCCANAAEASVHHLARALVGAPANPPDDPDQWLAAHRPERSAAADALLLTLGWIHPDDPRFAPLRAAPGAIRDTTARAAGALLIEAARVQPLAIILDDADRADPTLLDALEHATLAEWRAPIFACLLGSSALARDRLTHGARAGSSCALELGPLAHPDSAELVRELLHGATNLSDAAISTIHARTRGLPRLVVELCRALRAAGALRPIAGSDACTFASEILDAVPSGPLEEVVAQRQLDELPPALLRHAAFTAILGPELDVSLHEVVLEQIEAVSRPLPTGLDPRVGLRRLQQLGVLRCDDEGRGFHNSSLREQAANRLPQSERASVHAAAFAVLLEVGDDRVSLGLVRHAFAAGYDDAGIEHALLFAERSAQRHAYLEAEHLYGLALAHASPDEARRWRALHGRGSVRFRLGRHHEARVDLENAGNDLAARRDASAYAELLLDAAMVADWCEDYPRAEQLAFAAREVIAAQHTHSCDARLALALGRAEFRRGQIAAAIALLEEASDAAERLGEAAYETRVIALLLLAPLLGMSGAVERSLPLFDALFELCRSHGDRLHLATAYLNRPFVWIAAGNLEYLRADLEQVIALARESGFPLLECRARYNLGEIAYLLGELAEAERHALAVIDLQQRLGEHGQRVLVARVLAARARIRAGDRAGARAQLVAIRAEQAAARMRASSDFELAASDEVLCEMVELACDDVGAASWAELIERSRRDSVQQEHLEVLEIAGLAAHAHGRHESAESLLRSALALTETTVTLLRPRIEAALAELRRAG